MSITDQITDLLALRVSAGVSLEVSSTLKSDLSLDSLDIVELAMALEDKFDIEIPDETMKEWEAVGDIVVTVAFLVGEKDGTS